MLSPFLVSPPKIPYPLLPSPAPQPTHSQSWPWHSPILEHKTFTRPRASPPNDNQLGQWIYFLLFSSPTDLTCLKDRLSISFCQTLKSMRKCSVPSVRAQCCLSCPQAPSIHTQRQRKQQLLQNHDML
jgi:hypothetical protein